MPAGNPQAYMRQGMPRKQAFALALQKLRSNRGRRVGRNLTPGVPRKVGRRMDFRDTNFNRGVAPGERPPGTVPTMERRKPRPLPIPGNQGPVPPTRPRPTGPPKEHIGMRRLGMLQDENRRNDAQGLIPLLRIFNNRVRPGAEHEGEGFGEMLTGEKQGTSVRDFFDFMRPYIRGTGYGRMLRKQANMPVRSKKSKTRPPKEEEEETTP